MWTLWWSWPRGDAVQGVGTPWRMFTPGERGDGEVDREAPQGSGVTSVAAGCRRGRARLCAELTLVSTYGKAQGT